ncbi:hypothetical protein QA641_09545 [Bradyrhizobium sp. CB1650]|nr:hypothetical protein [Bradyrhizobium sp. CB1650]WGD54117.1 hypothetical protein QA641_09545 [Bradyrhizobium sp. CB1650]
MLRRRFKQMYRLKRAFREAEQLREEAKRLPPGLQRDNLLRSTSQEEIASHITEWLTSPGLKPPT